MAESDPQSKLKKLEDAGILEQRLFTPAELALVATITDAEISVLIGLKQKLSPAGDTQSHIRPNFAV